MTNSSDTYLWINQYGGAWGTATNWMDTTIGAGASIPPGSGNSVAITGGTNSSFTSIVGTGAASQLAIGNDVLLWGTVTVGGAVTLAPFADLDFDGGATLSAASLNIASGASLEVGGGSTLKVTGTAILAAGFFDAVAGSRIQLGGLVANSVNNGFAILGNTIAVDANSSIEVGTAGGAALGALTIDTGLSAAITGTIDGNVVVKGILGVQAYGALAIGLSNPFGSAPTISGTGTLVISENSLLTLGVADSAAIRFGGPAGTLDLQVLPTATISGFAAGDIIEIAANSAAFATGLSYTLTSNAATLTLTKGGVSQGTLTLAGNYAGSLFHLGLDADGDDLISLQPLGSAPTQPSLIVGTGGLDTLTATANSQTLTALGGNDLLAAATFTGIVFKDTSANLNGDTITSFAPSDVIDLTDMNSGTVSVGYLSGGIGQGTLTVVGGTRTATISLPLGSALSTGYFTAGTDGASGTNIRYVAVNADAYSFGSVSGGFATASLWQDITTGATATAAPSYGNDLTIAGGAAGPGDGTAGFIDVTGTGFAASLTTSGDVLLRGSLVFGSKLTGVTGTLTQADTLALDGGSSLLFTGSATIAGLVEVGGGSTLIASGLDFAADGASLLAIYGGSAQFATVLPAAAFSGGTQYAAAVIGVDGTSRIEIGTAGNATKGALTIDSGITANLGGSINGNVVVNGTLLVAGALAITSFGLTTPSITGSGTIVLTWGDTLTLAGTDSAAILFSQTPGASFSSATETLGLAAILPTGTITGFSQGDVITLAQSVTRLSYSQNGGAGTLTLFNGAVTIGALHLSGVYAASRFQVQLAANGLSSSIIYAAAPNPFAGSQTSGTTDGYAWNNPAGGTWSYGGNWIDTTTGGPTTAAPDSGNAVTISDDTGSSTAQVISGTGSAASLTIASAANTLLTGTISVAGAFTVASFGPGSGDVALTNDATLSAGSLSITSPFQVSGGSALAILGSGAGTFLSGNVTVFGGSTINVAGGPSVITGMIGIDPTSSIEFGTAGGAAAGTLTIDSLQAPTLQGNAAIAAKLVVNGSLLVYSGTIGGFGGSTGSIGGTGTITIGALGSFGSLVLNASDSAAIVFQSYTLNGVPIAFETLQLNGPLPTGVISGFVAGDTIVIGRTVTGVAFRQTTGTQATLTLTNGATTVGTLILGGSYTTNLFQVDVNPSTGFATISMEAATTAVGAAAASTGNDAYGWAGASGGSWTNAANWTDTTTATTPVTMPGTLDAVTIAGGTTSGQYTTIGGNGSAASLTTSGNVLLTGQVGVAGQLQITPGSGQAGTLALEAGARLTVAGRASITGTLEVGGASSATIAGTASLSGGALLALAGSTVQVGGLIGNGGGNVIAVDANSIIKIGAPATAVVGTLTQAANVPAAFAGSIYGKVVANGTFSVPGGGTLMIDMTGTAASNPYATTSTITGTGVLSLTEGSTLGLGVTDSVAIQFAGPNATLLLGAIPTATITGFVAGDQIQIDRTVTGIVYKQLTSNTAMLTLNNGVNYVGTLRLAGNYAAAGTAFHLDADPGGDTAVITLQSLLIAPAQPSLIRGTMASDLLTATANSQILSGSGGGDTLSGSSFTAIDFRDLTASLAGSTIQDFDVSDILDFTDMKAKTATETYANGILSITDGTHAATLSLGFANTPASGSFHIAGDGVTGTKLTWS